MSLGFLNTFSPCRCYTPEPLPISVELKVFGNTRLGKLLGIAPGKWLQQGSSCYGSDCTMSPLEAPHFGNSNLGQLHSLSLLSLSLSLFRFLCLYKQIAIHIYTYVCVYTHTRRFQVHVYMYTYICIYVNYPCPVEYQLYFWYCPPPINSL